MDGESCYAQHCGSTAHKPHICSAAQLVPFQAKLERNFEQCCTVAMRPPLLGKCGTLAFVNSQSGKLPVDSLTFKSSPYILKDCLYVPLRKPDLSDPLDICEFFGFFFKQDNSSFESQSPLKQACFMYDAA